jgi:hypothetical protein
MNATTALVLDSLDSAYEQKFGQSFTQALLKQPKVPLQKATSASERKNLKRKHQRECRESMSAAFSEQDAISVLAEGQSLSSYKRMRMSQCFETPDKKKKRASQFPKRRKHSPSFDNATWNKERVLQDLQNFPENEVINWARFAIEHGITGRNRGQIVKEFAMEIGIDVQKCDKRASNQRVRARKLKLPGAGITVPTHRSVEGIKEDWAKMISEGQLTLGELCAPYTLKKNVIVNERLTTREEIVYGRKVPLISIRQKLLEKHEPHMRLHTDDELNNMTKEDLLKHYKSLHIQLPDDTSMDSLRTRLMKCETTRTWAIWHDHSTIAGRGYVLVTCKIVYDPAAFKTDSELHNELGKLQAFIEEPEIHILALSSSSKEDQAAIISDRIECLKEMSEKVKTSKGIEITDKVFFFVGDKPAAQFERGTQQGGSYKCGSCGCKSTRMDDFAHSLTHTWRSLADLQALILSG